MNGKAKAWAGLIVALCAGALQVAPSRAAPLNAKGDIVVTAADLARNGQASDLEVMVAGAGDSFPSTTLYPSVGLLYLTRDGAVFQQCAGVVIGDREILTAAHCVCGDAEVPASQHRDFQACRADLPRIGGRFFSPVSGFTKLRGAPTVHPRYHYPDVERLRREGSLSTLEIFDLAILRTADRIGAPAAAIDREPAHGGRYAFASIGPYASYQGDMPDAARTPEYYPLVGKVTLLQPAGFGAECQGQAARDTLCEDYQAMDLIHARRSTFGCPGDSGSGLFRFENGRPGPLLGLASYVVPPHAPGRCVAKNRRTMFVNLTQSGLADWIAQATGSAASAPQVRCDDGWLSKASQPYAIAIPNLVSLSVMSLDDGANFEVLSPAASDCEHAGAITHCRIAVGTEPRLLIRDRGAQITLCWT